MSVENLLSGFGTIPEPEEIKEELSPTDKVPVPRPRKHTLERDGHVHKPLPVPRYLRSPVPSEPPNRPPKPSKSGGKQSPERKAKLVPLKAELHGGRMSPPHTRAPSPKPQLPSTKEGNSSREGNPPKAAPRRRRNDDAPADDLQGKDPSQLPVKERMMLAQKAMKKPPPVLPKKSPVRIHAESDPSGPKFLSQPEGETDELPSTRYSHDFEASPRHVRKLPPGAFNMGLPGMAPFGAPRQRSHTVATSRENSLDREGGEDHMQMMHLQREAEMDMGSREALDTEDVELKFPPRRPPLPKKRTSSDEKPAHGSPRNNPTPATAGLSAAAEETEERADTDGGDSPLLQGGEYGTLPDPAKLDFDQVLSWSPVQVASWMNRIGLGQHTKVVLDRGVQGHKLFDLDGGALKVSQPYHILTVFTHLRMISVSI